MHDLSRTTSNNSNYSGFALPPSLANSVVLSQIPEEQAFGIYCRLSREDKRSCDQSLSIENQKRILLDYAESNKYNVRGVYDQDDGYSGTTFDRPGWALLMADVAAKNINAIMVKDLSRLARNSAEADGFIEEYCVQQNLRLIAVQDNVDCLDGEVDDSVSMRNYFNELHAKNTSRSVRNSKRNTAMHGLFTGSYAPFGYQKDPTNKHKLLPSEDAPIIQEIFTRIANGETTREIADDFNKRGIITPSQRIVGNDPTHPNRVPVSLVWTSQTISSILNNVVHIGHLAQGKRRNLSYKSKKRVSVPAEKHIVVLDTHEAIVAVDIWNAVQLKRTGHRKPRKSQSSTEVSLFAGIVKCSDCDSNLVINRKKGKPDEMCRLICAQYTNAGKHACSTHAINYGALYDIVLNDLRHYSQLLIEDKQALYDKLYSELLGEEQRRTKSQKGSILSIKAQLESVHLNIEKLYEEKWSGGITKEMFERMHKKYSTEEDSITKKLREYETEAAATRDTEEQVSSWMDLVKQVADIEELDRNILLPLIDRIVVHNRVTTKGKTKQRVEIYYKFVGSLKIK